jgi:CAAX prenyl protease-like protein
MIRVLWNHPLFPWCAPLGLFLALTAAQSIHPGAVYVVYPLKTVVCAILLVVVWRRLPPIRFTRPWLSAWIGVAVCVGWVGLDPWWPRWGERAGGFDPFQFEAVWLAWGLLVIRVAGAALVVPVVEELFWRGFLMRWLIRDEFEQVPLGTFQMFSFVASTLAFASVHDQWALALVAGVVYGAWFCRTRSLGDVMLAHGVTNLLLGLHVARTGAWHFW